MQHGHEAQGRRVGPGRVDQIVAQADQATGLRQKCGDHLFLLSGHGSGPGGQPAFVQQVIGQPVLRAGQQFRTGAAAIRQSLGLIEDHGDRLTQQIGPIRQQLDQFFKRIGGGGVGPRVTGEIFDLTGSYDLAFKLCFGLSLLSGFAIWMASPRKVRSVRR